MSSFSKDNFARAIFILFIRFYTILGAGHLPAHSVPTPGSLPTSFKKMLMPRGYPGVREGGMGTSGID